jgi:hypothetical protein
MYRLVYGAEAALSAMPDQAVALKSSFSKLLQVATDFAMTAPYVKTLELYIPRSF